MSDLLTTSEAAEILGVTPRRVRAMIEAGLLKAKTVGVGMRATHFISREEVIRVKKSDRKPGRRAGSKNKKKERSHA